MKSIFKISALTAAALSFAACQDLNTLPVFDSADSFVAFAKESVAVNEDAGTVTVTFKQVSIDPVATTVTYNVIAYDDDTTYTAKADKNFSKATADDGLVVFDGTTREKTVTFNVFDGDGDGKFGFTGDLTFGVEIVSASNGIKLGEESLCTVTITDLDHPLSELFGTYTASAYDAYYNKPASYDVTITKDGSSLKSVLIYNLGSAYYSDTYPVAATVIKDESGKITGLTIEPGQTWAYGSYTMCIMSIDSDGNYIDTDGVCSMSYSDGTLTWLGSDGYPGMFLAAIYNGSYYIGAWYSSVVLTKN